MAVAEITCVSLDLDSYTVTPHADIYYADGSRCGSGGGNNATSLGGQVLALTARSLCSTPYSDPRANQLQHLVVSATTSNGFSSGPRAYPLA